MKRISDPGGYWRPINRTAGLVVSKSTDTAPSVKRLNEVCSPFPLEIRRVKLQADLTGTRNGRLLVMGYHGGTKGKARWVSRCDCGNYTLRSRKAILNPENRGDRCVLCRHQAYLKRAQVHREYGKEVDVRDI